MLHDMSKADPFYIFRSREAVRAKTKKADLPAYALTQTDA